MPEINRIVFSSVRANYNETGGNNLIDKSRRIQHAQMLEAWRFFISELHHLQMSDAARIRHRAKRLISAYDYGPWFFRFFCFRRSRAIASFSSRNAS